MRNLLVLQALQATEDALRRSLEAANEANDFSPETRQAKASRLRIADADAREAWEAVASVAAERAKRAESIAEVSSYVQGLWADVEAKARLAISDPDPREGGRLAAEAMEAAEHRSLALAPSMRRSVFR